MYGFASIVSGMVSIWSIMVLSLERLWVIYWATRASVIRVRMSTMRVIIVTMWLLAIIMAILPLMGYSRYVYEVKRCFLGCYSYDKRKMPRTSCPISFSIFLDSYFSCLSWSNENVLNFNLQLTRETFLNNWMANSSFYQTNCRDICTPAPWTTWPQTATASSSVGSSSPLVM